MKKIIKINYKFIFIIIILTFNFDNSAFSKNYKVGDFLTKEIKFSKNLIYPVSDGDWEVIDKYSETIMGLVFKGLTFARSENNVLMELIFIDQGSLSGKQQAIINNLVRVYRFENRYDGCYERREYYIVEVYKRGNTHNCLIVRHLDLHKELTNPDDPEARGTNARTKLWLRKNKIEIPRISFASLHSYYSPLRRATIYEISHVVNPEILNAPKINYYYEDDSEYHKSNIDRFPEHKVAIEKWLSLSAKTHKYLEKILRAPKQHLLDLDAYILENDQATSTNANIIKELKDLNDLYESGAITEEEFIKAKSIILN
tara:strand:- start:2069 stop:3013 length:945 start_codon:yes stop_codon:yes gene_type:complete